jgi:O-antigen/teichoic acid export membrane protein
MGGLHRKANGGIPSVGQTSISNVLIVALGAVAGVGVARVLGPHGRGVYAVATIAPAFIGIAGTLGVEEAVVYLVGRNNDHRTTGLLIWSSFLLASVLGSIASAVSVAFQLLVFWRPTLGVSKTLFIAIACQPVLVVLAQVCLAHLRAQARYAAWNILRILNSLVYLMALVTVMVLGTLTVDAAILSLLAASVALLIGSLLPVCLPHRPATSAAEMRRMLSYGWKNHLITVQTLANQQLDQVFLAAMVPAAQLGQYAIAVTYASAGLALGMAPALQLYSHFSRQDSPDRAAYRNLVILTLVLLTGICLASGVLAPFFIPAVFGRSYSMAVRPALILILSSPMLSMSAIYSAIWKSAGKPLVAAKAQGIGLAFTVVTLPGAIIYLGIDGAAIVSIVAYSIVAALLWHSDPFTGLVTARTISQSSERTVCDSNASERVPTFERSKTT